MPINPYEWDIKVLVARGTRPIIEALAVQSQINEELRARIANLESLLEAITAPESLE